jgi:hypothetical protein
MGLVGNSGRKSPNKLMLSELTFSAGFRVAAVDAVASLVPADPQVANGALLSAGPDAYTSIPANFNLRSRGGIRRCEVLRECAPVKKSSLMESYHLKQNMWVLNPTEAVIPFGVRGSHRRTRSVSPEPV